MRFIVVFTFLFGVCYGDTKTWQQDVNFGNPTNWDKGRVPCASDSIKFPESVSVVFMQTNSTLKEILLPLNGALVLDNNVRIAFTDDSSVQPECTGEEQTFIADTPESWYNPGNWVGANGPVAVDTESVPCQYDQVVFPTEKLFSVGVDLSTTVGTVSFAGENFVSTMAFSSFLSSPSGQQQFSVSNNPTILLQNSQCNDLTGCVCGNDVEPSRTKICGFKSTCPALACRNAPIPVGGCCPVCGAIVTMEYNPQTFNYESVKTGIESKFGLGPSAQSSNSARRKRQADSDVTMYMSKTNEGKIQMVFTDSNGGSSSGQAAIRLALEVEDDIAQNLDSYGVTSVSMKSSEKGTGGLSGGGVSNGGIAGIIIAVIVIICFVSTVIFLTMRRNSLSWKDEPLHADSDIEMSQGLPPGFMQEIPNPTFDSAMRGFDNPMYTTTTKENIYADPAEVKVNTSGDEKKAAYVVEEKGAINGPKWEEDEDIKAFSNPMSADVMEESNA
ncbi:protein amnionless [Strongylocentrotus purpuratus]|uniref:Protein amnionless n=1 Tax=Strongylocentrotus purpuratus TaxID=7668 RepID=A0A7M7GPT3_STRPU|nr:protein amnionless [Strongylocentrotus purpuratus]|eukprot:XP_003726480.1 PREDICTED: protein amnionless [Strongylocentrotus purpuratus]